MVQQGMLFRIWQGIYSTTPPDLAHKLAGLDQLFGTRVAACLDSASQLWGFDVQESETVHVIDPLDRHRNGRPGLVAQQRLGAPITALDGQLLTAPAWTAVEVARSLPRPRALATLDAALRSGRCTAAELDDAARQQGRRRGICATRKLLPLADSGAQSPMESETRLLLLDAGLPAPTLQYPVPDRWGMPRYFLDFGWEDAKLGAEYDGDEFHSGALAVRRDKGRITWLQDQGWLIVYITADDVHRRPKQLINRLRAHLERADNSLSANTVSRLA
ncbi:DUF559 domain-containing protein [Antrihabitans cavernicola]|uniref:DUF559 domain-containing protein n=2 Tax=Antrihabitans cavernicola TaxID=2495913 RepID=A0A5A7SD32_9NOCA|nr:DUF559 domain-containing protein [Spelaeibacter cavernicola]